MNQGKVSQVWESSTHNPPSASSSRTPPSLSFLIRTVPGNVQARTTSPRLLGKSISHLGEGGRGKEGALSLVSP